MNPTDIVILIGAGFAGGCVNAIAGGATFFTFPAMLLVGIPPVTANASNAAALWPASIAAVWAQRRDLAAARRLFARLGLMCAAGGVGGALLLLISSDQVFLVLVPFLLLGATLLFAFSPRLLRWARARRGGGEDEGGMNLGTAPLALLAFAAVYGGYFGAGIGIIMLAALSFAGLDDVRTANVLKNSLAALINGVAVVIFVVQDLISWPATLVMLTGAVVGGFTGARIARRLSVPVFRAIVITVGSLLSAWYFWQLARP